ncbi:TIGR00269 family protein [Dictyocaulus viviparus]|uniref:TIGR00269 family protein n=1 Tax=Dictyocaulus viviparus TaxID=29172 RepID=A0A0D8Y7L3_DICVI|nr:TIGR00269 family protein [Dictyocaulus viviparus]
MRSIRDVHNTIVSANLFQRGERVAIGASGGKDSTVLAYVMKRLNDRYNYGLDLLLLSIDEGIKGYRDDSLKAVDRNRVDYCMPLTVLSYKDLYGWTMDEIVAKIGKKNNCTYCGVLRRQALDRGAYKLGASKILTGHNADDMAETVLMNVLRGDIARLQRCTNISTGEEGELPRAKPLKYCFEKDIVMYARLNKLDYFYTECKYAPDSYRAYSRSFIKDLERIRPETILGLIKSGESITVKSEVAIPTLINCTRFAMLEGIISTQRASNSDFRCGYISSQSICKACLLLEGLNTGRTDMGIKRKTKKLAIDDGEKVQKHCGNSCDCEQTQETSF